MSREAVPCAKNADFFNSSSIPFSLSLLLRIRMSEGHKNDTKMWGEERRQFFLCRIVFLRRRKTRGLVLLIAV